jgi:hypothetical protein
MGRTGTSLTTRIIGLLGVDLGEVTSMLPPSAEDNARGYWEQEGMMDLNDQVLSLLGGTWSEPPRLEPGWEHDPRLDPLLDRASRLIAATYPTGRRWGWKDPRNSVTLPFWRRVVGDMAYVVCFRDPVEVAASLHRRNAAAHPPSATFSTWLRLSAASLRHTEGEPRLLVFFDDWFNDTERQLARVADFIEPEPQRRPDGWEAAARSFVDSGLRHHRQGPGDLATDAEVPPEVRLFYLALRQGSSEASPIEPILPELLDVAEERRSLRARVEAGERELETALASAKARESELLQHRAWLTQIQSSASWRLTAPLRRAKRSLHLGHGASATRAH